MAPAPPRRCRAGWFIFGSWLSKYRPTRKANPEGWQVYAGSLLIPAASGTYSENGPVGADINPRRVRLIARRRQGLDASHAVRARSPADRAGILRGSFRRH